MIPPPLLRRIKVNAVALVAALALAAWSVAAAAPGGLALPRSKRGATIPFTDVHPYGANFFLEREVDSWTQEKTVELAATGGLRFAKQHFRWFEIEREPGVFEWAKYDAMVELYRSNGLEVIARLDWPAAWVKDDADDYQRGQNNPPDRTEDYAQFVAATVEHYKGRVRFFQIWNEPNLYMEWGNQPVDPVEYVALLEAAYRAAKEVDGNAVILSAPLAINTETIDIAGNLSDLDYLEGMYAAGAAEYFDVLSANAFGMDRPPEDPPSRDVLNFRRVELQREIMESNGDGDKPVWFAEYGWNAAPSELGERRLKWQRVSEEQQALWTVDGIEYARRNWPWSGVFSIWYFRQWGGKSPEEADYYFRMVDSDFTPRRVYGIVQEATQAAMVAGPGVWSERTSPVVLADLGDWSWQWVEEALDRNALVAAQPGAALRFRFAGSGVDIRTRVGPDAGSIVYEVDRRLALADDPASTPLTSEAEEWRWVTLANGLGDGAHELRLTAVGDGATVVDAFRVSSDESTDVRRFVPLLATALALGLAVLLVADVRRAGQRIRL